MAKLFQLLIFCILHLYSLCLNIPTLSAYHFCSNDQSLPLLNFKHSIQIDTYKVNCRNLDGFYYHDEDRSFYCDEDNNPINIESKISSWNSSTDCCSWGGVTCNEFTGKVIELDLSASQLTGVINSNSSIFQLSHLRRLNLAHNFLSLSQISAEFRRFTHLSHLNLASCWFEGKISSEISHLNELVSLDLSHNNGLFLEPHVFRSLIQNMTNLRELSLELVDISSSLPQNLSSSLTIVNLMSTNLQGPFPYHIFQLPNLRQLSLGGRNYFSGLVSLAGAKWNASSLQKLELPHIVFSGKLPDTIGNLKFLTYLNLSSCEFSGMLPKSFGNMTHLSHIDLSSNHFTGQIPPGILGLEHLILLDIGSNDLNVPIPHSASNNLKRLKVLSLRENKLTASSIFSILNNSTQLETIDLSFNPLYEIPLEFFELSLLHDISLRNTQLQGPFPKSFSNLVNLEFLDLASNNFSGPIEIDVISNLVNLKSLDLSSNNFDSTLDVKFLSNLKWMVKLSLSSNSLSLIKEDKTTLPMISIKNLHLASCNIRDLDVLRSIVDVEVLDLQNNNIQGEIPEWVWFNWSNVTLLDLSNNFITHIGKIPLEKLSFLNLGSNLLQGQLPVLPHSIQQLIIPNNQFHGEIQSSICELFLSVLDLSNNSFSGVLPHCIGTMGYDMEILDLHMNNLQGEIPDLCSMNQMQSLNLRGNQFEGKVPRSLVYCQHLEVLDVSENNLNDKFPIWLGDLPSLQILSLRSNKLYGHISSSHASAYAFSHLQILDLSCNQLNGTLPGRFFKGFKQMMSVNDTSKNYTGLTFGGLASMKYYNSMTIVLNGNTMKLERISDVMKIIDLSSNHFEGEIPSSIKDLISIQQLNLSHNKFTGRIPPQLGYLSNLHSLDMSSNQLHGNIPDNLAALGFLSVMNLSYNHLTGQIPYGRQLQTIPNDSYIGNDGLCGYPLSRNCGNDNPSMLQPPHVGVTDEEDSPQEFFDGFTWQSVVMGYGVGMFVGLVIGSLMLFTEKPKWLIRIVREEANKMIYKYKSRNGIIWSLNQRS